jgi:tetratricopeptide (TPR) repeat protein
VFWVHASNTARLEQAFQEIAEYVKIRGRKDPQADVFKLVHSWLQDKRNGPWFIVLDNADDASVLSPLLNKGRTSSEDNGANHDTSAGSPSSSALQQRLSKYLPPSTHGSILVTSRTRLAASQVVEENDVIPIEPMHQADAHALLNKKLGDKLIKSAEIAELATALDNMPLALVQAAAYIRKRAPRCSVRQYLTEYAESDSRKTSLLNQAAGHLRRDETASNAVLLTWQISFEHIRNSRRSAADLLSLMSFFDRQGIQEALLRGSSSTASDDDFEEDVVTLREYSFITVLHAKMFEMHSLVQLATRMWLENQDQLDKWRDLFIANLCAELPQGRHENREKCQALFPHAKAALAQQPKEAKSREKWALLLYNAACYAWQQRRAAEAEHMSTISMEVRRKVCGEESVETSSSMVLVGQAKEIGGKYEEAEAILKQALALKEKVLGPEHPDALMSMNNLASVLQSQGKYKEAEAMNRQTLALRGKVLEPEHPDMLMSMNNLALVLQSQGKYEEAEAMNRQTLVLREKVLGLEHPGMLISMNNLALVLRSQGKYREAEAMNRQTLALNEKVLGPEHPSTLMSMNNLASVLQSQGKYKEAEAMNRQTLALRGKVLGPEHPDTLASMNNLASVLQSQGKYEEAEAMNVLGPEHPETLVSMNNLACVLAGQRRYPESLALFERVCASSITALGKDHPGMQQYHKNCAVTRARAAEEQRRATPTTTQDVIAKPTRGLAKLEIGSKTATT